MQKTTAVGKPHERPRRATIAVSAVAATLTAEALRVGPFTFGRHRSHWRGLIGASALALALFGPGAGRAHATVLVDTVPFVFMTDGSQTVQLPQFNPALGALTAAAATVSATVEPLLEIFDTGRSQVAIAVQEFLTLGTLQARTSFSFGGFLPDNTPVDGVLFPAMQISASTSLDAQLAEFTGPGTIPFTLTLASPATLQQGSTVTRFTSSASATGAITFDYTYTPAPAAPVPPVPVPTAIPEPASLAVLGAGLVGLGLITRRRAGAGAATSHGSAGSQPHAARGRAVAAWPGWDAERRLG